MGVASVFAQEARFMARVRRVRGTSGGACAGAMLVLAHRDGHHDRFEAREE
jgi:hypothetical protein